MMNIPEWLAISVLTIIVAAIGWSIRRLVLQHDTIYAAVSDISIEIAKLGGKLETSALLYDEHKQQCDRRHDENVCRMNEITALLRTEKGPSRLSGR